MNLITSIHVERGGAELQDRAEIFQSGDRTILAIADGAGGVGGSAAAAEALIYNVMESCSQLLTPGHCHRLLLQVDTVLAGGGSGETTGIIAVITPEIIFGATVGDSGARIYHSNVETFLTAGGPLKPLLGSGEARVMEFGTLLEGTLVVATDGLWKYASSVNISAKIETVTPENLAAELVNLPRLRSGSLPDDIAVVTCRIKR